jgi:RNA:NAD 2'-phosphotransferase (TPT1/KptA family)
MAHDLARLSRVLSHALRHEPWLYELELDEHGWAGIDAVLAALRQGSTRWRDLAEQDPAELIRVSSKPRYELLKGRIRALYGHSLPGKLRHALAAPPSAAEASRHRDRPPRQCALLQRPIQRIWRRLSFRQKAPMSWVQKPYGGTRSIVGVHTSTCMFPGTIRLTS